MSVQRIVGLALLVLGACTNSHLPFEHASHYEQRVAAFRTYAPLNGGVAFVGDSLIERGNWPALFPGLEVRNYGINGDRTERLAERLDQVIAARPAKIFLMIGTNDIGVEKSDAAAIGERYRQLLGQIHRGLPSTQIFVESVLPREAEYADEVQALNRQLAALSPSFGAIYVDLYREFAVRNGVIDPAVTVDGLHLNALGYERWRNLIEPLVRP